MDIYIDDEVLALCPQAALGVLAYEADVAPASAEYLDFFDGRLEELAAKYTTDKIAQIPHIAATRTAYKALGKSPQSYRNAAEAMLRRIVKGNGLYRINNIIDINNLISVESGYSIGSYDCSKLQGAVTLRRAPEDTHYGGIGKASVNIGFLPTLYDETGAFGNPTSDSKRAMITEGHHTIYSILYSFDGQAGLQSWLDTFAGYLKQYCHVDAVTQHII